MRNSAREKYASGRARRRTMLSAASVVRHTVTWSNLVAAWPAYVAYKRRAWPECVLVALTAAASIWYHARLAFWVPGSSVALGHSDTILSVATIATISYAFCWRQQQRHCFAKHARQRHATVCDADSRRLALVVFGVVALQALAIGVAAVPYTVLYICLGTLSLTAIVVSPRFRHRRSVPPSVYTFALAAAIVYGIGEASALDVVTFRIWHSSWHVLVFVTAAFAISAYT